MTRWSEANFLERLMSPSSQQNIEQKNPCPDSELLAAFSENRVDGFVLGAIAAHLIQCADCADLHHRLLNLAKADTQADSAEWRNAEKRLDNWMNTYLRVQPGRMESGLRAKPVISTAGAGTGWRLYSSRVGWALGAVAVLELAAAIFFFKLGFPSRSRQAEVATQTAPVSPAPPSPAPSQEKSEPALENPPAIVSAPPAQEPQPAEERQPEIHSSSAKPKAHPAASRVPSADQNAVRREEKLVVPSNEPNTPAAPLETPETEGAGQAGVLAEPLANAPATPVENSSSAATLPNAAVVSKLSTNGAKGSAPVAKSTPASLPVLISLEYSTSMWMQLNSGSPPPDGTFHFQGTLLKPVELPAGVPFDTNTKVYGFGGVSDGRISLIIQEFLFRGVRYRLKRGNGMARVEPFNGGRTLEMWLDEDSVYERVPNASTAAAPRAGSSAAAVRSTQTAATPRK
jgi:hypothetical protein